LFISYNEDVKNKFSYKGKVSAKKKQEIPILKKIINVTFMQNKQFLALLNIYQYYL
jgi:hypothetical protein